MSSQYSIIQTIFKDISFSEKEMEYIFNNINKVVLKKGDIIISPNTFVYNQYYVENGCLRSYFIDKSGKEYTIQFAINDWWISDFISLFNSEKSIMYVECIQDSVVYEFPKENFEEITSRFPKLEFYRRRKLEKAYASFQKRILDNLSKTASERYLDFIKKYPNIEKNVKNYHIASYLGITTESLSRIRKTAS